MKYHLIAITIAIVLGLVGVKIINRPRVEPDFELYKRVNASSLSEINPIFLEADQRLVLVFPIGNRGIFIKGYMYPKLEAK